MTVFLARIRTTTLGLSLVIITLIASGTLIGQSGRQMPKPRQSNSTNEPMPKPTHTPVPKEKQKPSFTLKVVADLPISVYQIFPRPEFMPTWAVERLRTSILLDVRDEGLLSRRDAIKLAKAETEAYVVWLQLLDDPFRAAAKLGSLPAEGEVEINYAIFSPITGKAKQMGRVALNWTSIGSRPPSVGTIARSCHKGIYGNDFILLQATIEAAERIMSVFNIPIPADCPARPPGI